MKNPTVKDAKWLETYYQKVSGSTSAASVGLDPFKKRTELAAEMRDPAMRPDLSQNPNILKGVFGEPAALWWLQNAIELDVTPTNQNEFLHNPAYPHAHCLPDCYVEDGAIGEVKVVGYGVLRRIKDGGVPINYLVQCQHNMAVANVPQCHFAAFNFDYQDGYTEVIDRDDELIAKLMENEAAFLKAVRSNEDIHDPAFERSELSLPDKGKVIIDDPKALEMAREFLEAKRQHAELEEKLDGLKDYLQAAIGEQHTAFEFPGVARGTWPKVAGRKGFDHKLCIAENPAMAKYNKQGKDYRMFRLNPWKD